MFFNAQAIIQSDSKEKQRAANALIPTIIAYAGGQVDFTVDMGTEVRGFYSRVKLPVERHIACNALNDSQR